MSTLVLRYTWSPMHALVHRYIVMIIHRYKGGLVHRFTCTQVHGHIGTPVHWYTCTPIHWCTSTPVHRYTGTPVHLYSSTSGHRYKVIRVYQYIGITVHLYTDACTGAPVHRYDNTRCTRRPTLDLPSTSSSNWKKPNWHDRVDDSLPRSDFQPRQRGLLNPSCSALLLGWNHACVGRGWGGATA